MVWTGGGGEAIYLRIDVYKQVMNHKGMRETTCALKYKLETCRTEDSPISVSCGSDGGLYRYMGNL